MTGNDLAGEVRTKDFPVLDCDGHVVEPETVWSDYVEPDFGTQSAGDSGSRIMTTAASRSA